MGFTLKSDQAETSLDWLKWLFVWFLIAAIIAGNYFFADQATPLRIAGSLSASVIALVFIFFTGKGKRFCIFAKEAKTELRKVVWPTCQETIQSTVMVMVVVIIMALFLWGIDSILLWGIRFFTGSGA